MKKKISIRFFNDKEVRAVWNDADSRWWFSVLDVVGVLNDQDDYEKNRNYWKYLKARLKKGDVQLGSATNQLKLVASDGKKYISDVIDSNGVIALAKNFPNTKANRFIEWFIYSEETIDGKSKSKAYALFESSFIDSIEVGTVKGLQQIHAYLFGGLYEFAGLIRTKNISKSGFQFAAARFLPSTLAAIEKMPEDSIENVINKYTEMNIAHPFMEGNGRTARIWLDLILKKTHARCVDWSKINKNNYLEAMRLSVTDNSMLKKLITNALTNKIHDREMFMKGIDYSYYYEEIE
jgi:cell filamentation protein